MRQMLHQQMALSPLPFAIHKQLVIIVWCTKYYNLYGSTVDGNHVSMGESDTFCFYFYR